ncbi:hypothetical protein [Anaerospora sp.]|uniref:hypothetical protein n=1 Tax=Anaerospora sp. TaxID=1960278 RepID=UPI0028A21EC9|nr:hypothetical protein [Anaerospora sp.]
MAPTVYAEGADTNTNSSTQHQSTALLSVHDLKDGSVESVSVRESSIDAAAISAVKK